MNALWNNIAQAHSCIADIVLVVVFGPWMLLKLMRSPDDD